MTNLYNLRRQLGSAVAALAVSAIFVTAAAGPVSIQTAAAPSAPQVA